MPERTALSRIRRVELVLGLLLAAVSFAPWWTRHDSGNGASVWTGPYFWWLPVLLCVAIVAGRSLRRPGLGGRWAASGIVVALAVAGAGWLARLAEDGTSPNDGSHQLAWVLQNQGADVGTAGGQFDVAWGYPIGLSLMGLLLATFAVTVMLRRTG